MRPDRDSWAMALAVVTAQRATCLRRQVGCVLLNQRGHVLATGYNGVATGQKHCNEQTATVSNPTLKGRVAEHWEWPTVPVYAHACPGANAKSGTQLDACQAIHAEQNALLQCRDVYAIDTCYCTTSPCMTCVKLLLNTSCRRVVFLDEYAHAEAGVLWSSAERDWVKLDFKYDLKL